MLEILELEILELEILEYDTFQRKELQSMLYNMTPIKYNLIDRQTDRQTDGKTDRREDRQRMVYTMYTPAVRPPAPF